MLHLREPLSLAPSLSSQWKNREIDRENVAKIWPCLIVTVIGHGHRFAIAIWFDEKIILMLVNVKLSNRERFQEVIFKSVTPHEL